MKDLFFVHSDVDDYGLTPEEFRVFGRVMRRWNKEKGCIEGSRQMAKGCSVSDRTVRNCLFVLVAAGVLRRTDRSIGLSPRYDPMPFEQWVDPACLPEIRGRAQAYRGGAVRRTTAVRGTAGCGTRNRGGVVRQQHEENPMKRIPEGNPEDGRSPVGSRRRSDKQTRNVDPRRSHAAIQAVKGLIGRFPNKLTWDDLIAVLREDFDRDKLEACAKAWAKAGWNMGNLAWVFEWYVNRIPDHIGGTRNGTTDQRSRVGKRDSRANDETHAASIGDRPDGGGFAIVEAGWDSRDVSGTRPS